MMNFLFYWEPVIIFALVNVILVTGLYVTALSGQLSLATAAIAGIGGYCSAILTTNFDWSFLPAIIVAAGVGGAVGAFLGAIMVRMRDFVLKLTTLAFGEAMVVFAYNIEYIGGANSFTGIPLYTSFTVAVAATAVALFVAWRFDGSRLGVAARAVRDDAAAAAAAGISIRRIRVITFLLGASICGAGGAIQAHYALIVSPTELGFMHSLNYIIFMFFGGVQILWGGVVGAVTLSVLPEVTRFADEFRLILYGFVIVVVVLYRPQGLLTRRPTGASAFGTLVPRLPWRFNRRRAER